MSARILVAGVGNIFFSDDGFGAEVARRLVADRARGVRSLGDEEVVEITDFGIRSMHLALRVLDGLDLLVLIDALPRGGDSGCLYLIEPEIGDGEPLMLSESGESSAMPDAHGMDVSAVLASVRAMGGTLPRVVIVGCEPSEIGEGIGLSAAVQASVGPAVEMVRSLIGVRADVVAEHASPPHERLRRGEATEEG